MYLAQFPDWNRFVEKAALAEFADSDVGKLHSALGKIIGSMQQEPDLVEPEVPKTLLCLNELIARPGKFAKRAAFAVLRSIENMISKVIGYSAELADKTMSKGIDSASSLLTSKTFIGGLLALALGSAVLIQPFAGKIEEMQWLKSAVEAVQKELQRMANGR
jgi:hypothetical protein